MTKGNIFYSAVLLEDYKSLIRSANLQFVEGEPLTNQYSFIEDENAIKINSDKESSYLQFKLGRLFVGDVIEVECEFLNESGAKGKIGIDRRTLSDAYAETQFHESDNANEYSYKKLSFAVTLDGIYNVNVGLFSADTGVIRVRNVKVNVETINRVRDERDTSLFPDYIGVGEETMQVKQFKPIKLTNSVESSMISIPIIPQTGVNLVHTVRLRGINFRYNNSVAKGFVADIVFSAIGTVKNVNVISGNVTAEAQGSNLVVTLSETYTDILLECSVLSPRIDLIKFEEALLVQ